MKWNYESTKPGQPESIEVATSAGGLRVRYELRRSRRARFLRLSIGHGGLARLTVPWTCSYAEARKFIIGQGDWLAQQLANAQPPVSLVQHLERHPQLSALGKTLDVQWMDTRFCCGFLYALNPPQVILKVPADNPCDGVLKTLLRRFAAEVLPQRTYALAESLKLNPGRVTVRDQSSRWGSCSSHGTLSLNWRLLLLPAATQDHVIYHELAHLTHLDHSRAFWRLLRQYDPQTDAHNCYLTATAAPLIGIGR